MALYAIPGQISLRLIFAYGAIVWFTTHTHTSTAKYNVRYFYDTVLIYPAMVSRISQIRTIVFMLI